LRHDNIASLVPFDETKSNFYDCARYGLDATVTWTEGQSLLVRELILGELLTVATEGLLDLGIDAGSANQWLGIIRARAENRQNGAFWQRSWVSKNGHDMLGMVARYYELQQSEKPVYEWPV